MSSPPAVRLLGLGTVVPPFRLTQEVVEAGVRRRLGGQFQDFERLAASFRRAGVERRYSVVPLDWFDGELDWPARNAAYLSGAEALFIAATERALAQAGLAAADIDTVVTVSSTGIATPSLEARVAGRLGFRADVARVPVFGLGCAGGVTGLSLGARLARARPGSPVLVVAVESCTLGFRPQRPGKADIVATMLFGDGAAAACLSTEGASRVSIGDGAEHTWPDTLGVMGWQVEPDGLGVIFDRSIPRLASEKLAEAVHMGLGKLGLPLAAIGRFVCHPGGARVVTAVEQALALGQGTLAAEREILRDFGNMSAPTVLFVLERALRAGAGGQMLMLSLGPGFTASMLSVTAG